MQQKCGRILVGVAIATGALLGPARGQVKFSEIYFDSPSSDSPNEYIEIKGTPSLSLNNYYLVFVENEFTGGTGGHIDSIFDLSGQTMGTNGYTVLRMKNALHTGIAPGTNVLTNTSATVAGWGYGGIAGGTTVGYHQAGDPAPGEIENGGFSAFVVHIPGGITTAARPTVQSWTDYDLDAGDNGLDTNVDYSAAGPHYLYDNNSGDGKQWQIIDSIAQNEVGESDSTVRTYAKNTFSANNINNKQPGATNVFIHTPYPAANTPLETEYLARWAGSTGTEANDYVMANLTDNSASGWTSGNRWSLGYRVSGQHNGNPYGEFYRGAIENAAPYGTAIQNTLGRANYPVPDGDLSGNTLVDQADLNIIVANFGTNDPTKLGWWLGGDPVANGIVDKADLDWVMSRWPLIGSPNFTTPDFGVLAGDVNLDGIIDRADLGIVARNWRLTIPRGYENADYTYDGTVDIRDLRIMLSNWQGGYASFAPELLSFGIDPTAVPEPTGLSLILLGVTTLTCRRRNIR